jgi:hypothetical protein
MEAIGIASIEAARSGGRLLLVVLGVARRARRYDVVDHKFESRNNE